MSSPRIIIGVAALFSLLPLRAQLKPSVAVPAALAVGSASTDAGSDRILAGWMSAGCDSEVVLARVAVKRAQNSEVKRFAQRMVADHEKVAADLAPFVASDATPADAGTVKSEGSKGAKAAERVTVEASSDRSAGSMPELDHLALIRELNERCLASQLKMFEATADADFDRVFMRAQVGHHGRAAIMAEVFAEYASSELRPTLEQVAKGLRAHLEQANTLCAKCEKEAVASLRKAQEK